MHLFQPDRLATQRTAQMLAIAGHRSRIIADMIAEIEAVERSRADTPGGSSRRHERVPALASRATANSRCRQSPDEGLAILLQERQQPDEVVRQRRLPLHALPGHRMIQLEETGMQRLPWNSRSVCTSVGLAAGGIRKRPAYSGSPTSG